MSSKLSQRIAERVLQEQVDGDPLEAVDEELAEVRQALGMVDKALKIVPQDALGRDPQDGYFYRDELAGHVTRLLQDLDPEGMQP